MISIFDGTLRGLAGALEVHQQRHRIITENIANVETPGYRAREVGSFRDALEGAFSENPVGNGRVATVVVDPSAPVKLDGNSVDLDIETTRLADNAFRIITLTRVLQDEYADLKDTISKLS